MANKLQCGQTSGHQIGKVEAPQNFLFKYQVILNLSSLSQLKHCPELQVKKEIEKGTFWSNGMGSDYELKKNDNSNSHRYRRFPVARTVLFQFALKPCLKNCNRPQSN